MSPSNTYSVFFCATSSAPSFLRSAIQCTCPFWPSCSSCAAACTVWFSRAFSTAPFSSCEPHFWSSASVRDTSTSIGPTSRFSWSFLYLQHSASSQAVHVHGPSRRTCGSGHCPLNDLQELFSSSVFSGSALQHSSFL